MMEPVRNNYIKNAKRIVVKVGSGILTEENGLHLGRIRSITEQICTLIGKGYEVLLVSSGAMASGIRKIGLARRPDELPKRQAVAAVGQAGLILEYEKAFLRYQKKVAQILLTSDGLSNRKRYLNARNTLHTLLSWKIIPIINENDTISVEEIKFGDNDTLAALITLLMDADLLILLTDIDGLFDQNPRTHTQARLIPVVPKLTKEIESIAGKIPGALGTGGMLSKIEAAKKLTSAGIPMIIANGSKSGILIEIMAGKEHGTFFIPKGTRLNSRKSWIAFQSKPKGTLFIDEGAATAIVKRGKSLLSSGIIGLEGDFQEGAPVRFSKDGRILGSGLVNYNAADIRKIMGLNSNQIKERLGYKPYDEVVHRDNLVISPID
ncbi:MAG: glutamate 5-kinase [Thermodesulfobacteriota bacterium]